MVTPLFGLLLFGLLAGSGLLSSGVIREQHESKHEPEQKQQSEFNLAFHSS
jgi:hypothetical protein